MKVDPRLLDYLKSLAVVYAVYALACLVLLPVGCSEGWWR